MVTLPTTSSRTATSRPDLAVVRQVLVLLLSIFLALAVLVGLSSLLGTWAG